MAGHAAESDVGVGTIVAGTYKIVSMLGRGGMGAVWEAHHTRLPGKRVAIKVLHPSVAADPESLARFKREAEIACRLGHPNIVEVHDFNKLENGSPYLILELLEGMSLDERLRSGVISIEACEAYLRQIGSALECAHSQGVVHRDLKPQNIFLLPSPTGDGSEIIKVLDFGISKIRGSQTVKTQDSTLLGTPQYMAPEQAVGQHEKVDARTDIFALGAMLYELLSGVPPFSGQNIPEVVYKVVHAEERPIAELVPGLSREQAEAIHKCLAKAQDDRFAEIDDLVVAFTGSPLPDVLTSGIRRISANARNASLGSAETVDSSKIDLAQAATVASQSQEMPAAVPTAEDFGSAETIDSSKLDKSALSSYAGLKAGPAETVAQSPTSGRGRLALIAIALLGAAAAAFALTRDTGQSKSPADNSELAIAPDPQDAAVPRPAEIHDAAVAEAVAVDAAGIVAASAPDAGKSPPRADRKPRPKPPVRKTEAVVGASSEVVRLLAEARRNLKAGNLDKVIDAAVAANRIEPTARGYALQAAVHCRRGDMSSFNQALRKMPRARARVARAKCKNL